MIRSKFKNLKYGQIFVNWRFHLFRYSDNYFYLHIYTFNFNLVLKIRENPFDLVFGPIQNEIGLDRQFMATFTIRVRDELH